MIGAISAWVRDLAAMALVLAFVEMLLPRNDLRRFARVVVGLVLVATILGSLVNLSSLEEALATWPAFDAAWPPSGATRDFAAEGGKVAQAGLEVVSRDISARFERQVQSLARLASQADDVDARVKLGPFGDILAIHVVVRTDQAGQADGHEHGPQEGSGARGPGATLDGLDDEGTASTALATEVERSLRDFYGLDDDVPVVVQVLGAKRADHRG
ncbi:MAG: stage III sporulation protein AF [Firmicutes bacterium]|jgi:stage III sporulation protein AF|nr:stage III sporulation protein AF [Bacillota bacterium]MDH7495068.1 stage III sporulation protein AF [Bacillota bacterium]